MGREGIGQYLYMMDQAFDSNDGWHSLMKNVEAVRDDDWGWVPEGGKRSIARIVRHCGARYMYSNHMFGDRAMTWATIPPPPALSDHAGMIAWVREAFRQMREGVAALTDDAELSLLRESPFESEPGAGAPWRQAETRWLITVMIQHDLYHAGEINHIRALRQAND